MKFFNIKFLFHVIVVHTFAITTCCEDNKQSGRGYLGGKIINPKSKFVILFKNETVIDTFQLNRDGTFLAEIQPLNEGLYYFVHGYEHQYVYLKPKDSLLIRLNAWDFDETLVFSGKGAKRNNILIDCFLESEEERKKFYPYYALSPDKFISKVNAFERQKLARFRDFVNKHPDESDQFNTILEIALTYPLYTRIENYPMVHALKINEKERLSLGNDFYKHRDFIRLNDDSMMYFHAYREFIISNLYNKASSEGHELSSNEFTIDVLKTISKEVKNENSKNSLLKQTVIAHFYRKSSCDINKDAFDIYLNLSTRPEDKRLVRSLLKDVEKIKKGVAFQDFSITDHNKIKRSVKRLTKNKNSVLFFWNPEFISESFITSRIDYFSYKYPSLNFIGVRIADKNAYETKKKETNLQYYLESDSKANAFLTSKMPRTILIDKKGFITNGFASLSSRRIHKQLEDLVKK